MRGPRLLSVLARIMQPRAVVTHDPCWLRLLDRSRRRCGEANLCLVQDRGYERIGTNPYTTFDKLSQPVCTARRERPPLKHTVDNLGTDCSQQVRLELRHLARHVRRCWQGESALGRRLKITVGKNVEWATVVGVEMLGGLVAEQLGRARRPVAPPVLVAQGLRHGGNCLRCPRPVAGPQRRAHVPLVRALVEVELGAVRLEVPAQDLRLAAKVLAVARIRALHRIPHAAAIEMQTGVTLASGRSRRSVRKT